MPPIPTPTQAVASSINLNPQTRLQVSVRRETCPPGAGGTLPVGPSVCSPQAQPGPPVSTRLGVWSLGDSRLRQALGWAPSRKALPTPVHSKL